MFSKCKFVFLVVLNFVAAQDETTKAACSLCPFLYGDDKLDCPGTSPDGCLGDIVTCRCKFDCRNITMQCQGAGNWISTGGPLCLPDTSYNEVRIGNNTLVSYEHTRGHYTFTCDAGFTLQGASSVTCANNQLSQPFPKCAKSAERETVLETEANTPSITIATEVVTNATAIPPTIKPPTKPEITTMATITRLPIASVDEITKSPATIIELHPTTIKIEEITIKNNNNTITDYETSDSLSLIIIVAVVSTFIFCGTVIGLYFTIQHYRKKKIIENALKRTSVMVPNMYSNDTHDTSYLKYLSMVDANFMFNAGDKDDKDSENGEECDEDGVQIRKPRVSMV